MRRTIHNLRRNHRCRNLDEIKIIEGLLFISMLPLHKDHFERQLALYSIGIQRLNEALDNFGKND